MGCVTLHRRFDIAAPCGSSARVSSTAIRRPSSPRRGVMAAASPRRSVSRWLRGFASLAVVRSQRIPLASPSPKLSTADGGDALTYPARMAALGRVVASTRGVLAAQAHVAAHNAARSPNP